MEPNRLKIRSQQFLAAGNATHLERIERERRECDTNIEEDGDLGEWINTPSAYRPARRSDLNRTTGFGISCNRSPRIPVAWTRP